MTKNRLRYLAKGFALGRDAAEKEHGTGCCCKNCPWNGNHGRDAFRTIAGTTAFANAFAEAHAEALASARPGAVYRAVAEAYSRWKIVGGAA